MVVSNPRTLEAKAGRSKVQGQSDYVEQLWLIEIEKEKEQIVWLVAV